MRIKLYYGHDGQFTILFAETIKSKRNIHFLFWNVHLLQRLSFEKLVPTLNIQITKKGAHLNFAMGAILHRYATVDNRT